MHRSLLRVPALLGTVLLPTAQGIEQAAEPPAGLAPTGRPSVPLLAPGHCRGVPFSHDS